MASNLEEKFLAQVILLGLPEPDKEFKFLEQRKFRFDFAWPDKLLAVEIDGGTWSKGRHSRGAGYQGDCIKINLAQLAGWRVLRFTADMVRSGMAITTVEMAIAQVAA